MMSNAGSVKDEVIQAEIATSKFAACLKGS